MKEQETDARRYSSQPPDGEWDNLRSLVDRLTVNPDLQVDRDEKMLILRVANQVGFSDREIEQFGSGAEGFTKLAAECRSRIKNGSRILGDGLIQANALREKGLTAEAIARLQVARHQLVVPFYRELADAEMRRYREG